MEAIWQQEDARVVSFARQLWEQTTGSIPVDYTAVAEYLGISIAYQDAPPGFRGWLSYEQKKPIIILNQQNPDSWHRYATAHEMGHYLVDKQEITVRSHRRERICQLFAANLVMPPDQVTKLAEQYHGKYDFLQHMAVAFGVTESAMCIQLRRLHILPGDIKATAEKTIADRHWCDELLRSDLEEAETDQRIQRSACYVPLFEVDVDAIYRKLREEAPSGPNVTDAKAVAHKD